jgi:hypothetical protein
VVLPGTGSGQAPIWISALAPSKTATGPSTGNRKLSSPSTSAARAPGGVVTRDSMRQPVPAGNHRSRHTQERVRAGEAIGGRDAAAPHGGRATAGRIGTLLLDRALPATLIGFLAAVKGWLTVQAAAALTAVVASGPWPFGGAALPGGLLADLPGPLPGAALHLAVEALGLAYYGLIAVLFVVRLPRLGGRRRPLTVVVALFGALALLGIGVLPGDQPTRRWTGWRACSWRQASPTRSGRWPI